MRWQLSRRNEAGEDRRRPWTLFPAVIGGSVLVLLLAAIAMLRGNDLVSVLPLGNSSDAQTDASPPQLDPEDELTDFVAGVMAETQAAWHERFREMGGTYQEPSLVIFSDTPESACNLTQATAGPFYCPADQTVYVDLDFSQDLWSRNDASRDLALAYAIAHEVGHHVQNLLGISQEVQRIQQQVSASEAEQLWLRLELQADCFAGIWAYAAQETRQMPQAGDVEAALTASSAVGNDRLSDADLQGDRPQAAASGDVMPDTFTHGSAAQRLHWFSQGMAQGAIAQCNTFAALDP